MNLTNSGETVVTTYNYDAFGNILAGSSANNNIGFQTKPFEGTDIGLYYSRARYYDPEVGRFTSKDPIGLEGGINLYVYAGNNPVNWVDPEGLEFCGPGKGIWEKLIPDKPFGFDFGNACEKHDNCYANPGTRSKQVCDSEFLDNMREVCNNTKNPLSRAWCRNIATKYAGAVRGVPADIAWQCARKKDQKCEK